MTYHMIKKTDAQRVRVLVILFHSCVYGQSIAVNAARQQTPGAASTAPPS